MKIGIFGGTFDPVHKEHIEIARKAKEEFSFDKMIIIPAKAPPHKNQDFVTNDIARLKMAEIAFAGFCDVSDFEFQREEKSYTYFTLQELKKQYKNDELYFLLGGDSLNDIEKWKNPEIIISLAHIVVCGRKPDFNANFYKKHKSRIHLLKYQPEDISSTDIRIMTEFGIETKKYLTEDIISYIKDNNLYRKYSNLTEFLKANVSERRFFHSLEVTKCGIKIGKKLSLDEEKLFVALSMHDIGKNFVDNERKYESITTNEALPFPVKHAFYGAEILSEFGINDHEILDAIRYHTTARPNMSLLEKVVFVADLISNDRVYKQVEELRNIVNDDFEKGFLACLNSSYEFLKEKEDICKLTGLAYEHYIKGNK